MSESCDVIRVISNGTIDHILAAYISIDHKLTVKYIKKVCKKTRKSQKRSIRMNCNFFLNLNHFPKFKLIHTSKACDCMCQISEMDDK